MPFKSKAQQRFMFAKHPEIAKEFADATPDIKKLPEHVSDKPWKGKRHGGRIEIENECRNF
ncbi:MAG: hypothetical protein ACHP9Y_01325 [Gammaproteobacteria bacterium]